MTNQSNSTQDTEAKYVVKVTMPSGEKLPPIYVDRDAFLIARAEDVGRIVGHEIAQLVEQRLKQ